MVERISFERFCDRFADAGRKGTFSYEGLKALYDYLEWTSQITGEEYILDVVELCSIFTEYPSASEALEELVGSKKNEKEALANLQRKTTVLKFDKGIIVQPW